MKIFNVSWGKSPNDELVCYCFKIYRSRIVDIIKENSAKTVEDVQQYCSASTGCGGCRPDIEDLLEEIN